MMTRRTTLSGATNALLTAMFLAVAMLGATAPSADAQVPQGFETTAAGSAPSGWYLTDASAGGAISADANFSVSTTNPHTGSKAFFFNKSNYDMLASPSTDTNGGNGIWDAYFETENSTGVNLSDLTFRATGQAINGSTRYMGRLLTNGGQANFGLAKSVNDADTNYVFAPAFTYTAGAYYHIRVYAVGSLLKVGVQRLSDGFWENASGAWVSDPTGNTYCASVTDTTLTGAGYYGFSSYSVSGSAGWRADDLTFTPVTPHTATTFYVDATSGSDANDGLAATTGGGHGPWQTLAQASAGPAGGYVPGDTVKLASGQTFAGTLTCNTSGTASAPIIFTTTGAAPSTISTSTVANDGVDLTDCEYVTVSNLRLTGPGVSSAGTFTSTGSGVKVLSDAFQTGTAFWGRITLQNLTIDNYFSGVTVTCTGGTASPYTATGSTANTAKGFRNLTLEAVTVNSAIDHGIGTQIGGSVSTTGPAGLYPGIYVDHCLVQNVYGNAGSSAQSGHGIIIFAGQSGVIQYCQAHDCAQKCNTTGGGPVGIWVAFASNMTIQQSEAYNIGVGNTTGTLDMGGFDIDAASTACTIQQCYSHDNYGPGFQIDGVTGYGAAGGVVQYCISENDARQNLGAFNTYGPTTSALFINNTVYMDGSHGVGGHTMTLAVSGGSTSIIAYNNVFILKGGATANLNGADPHYWQNNLYWMPGASAGNFALTYSGTTYTTLASWQAAAGTEGGGRVADPLLTSPGLGTVEPLGGVSLLTNYDPRPGSPAAAGGAITTELFGPVPNGPLDFHSLASRQGTAYSLGAVAYPASGFFASHLKGSRPASKGGH